MPTVPRTSDCVRSGDLIRFSKKCHSSKPIKSLDEFKEKPSKRPKTDTTAEKSSESSSSSDSSSSGSDSSSSSSNSGTDVPIPSEKERDWLARKKIWITASERRKQLLQTTLKKPMISLHSPSVEKAAEYVESQIKSNLQKAEFVANQLSLLQTSSDSETEFSNDVFWKNIGNIQKPGRKALTPRRKRRFNTMPARDPTRFDAKKRHRSGSSSSSSSSSSDSSSSSSGGSSDSSSSGSSSSSSSGSSSSSSSSGSSSSSSNSESTIAPPFQGKYTDQNGKFRITSSDSSSSSESSTCSVDSHTHKKIKVPRIMPPPKNSSIRKPMSSADKLRLSTYSNSYMPSHSSKKDLPVISNKNKTKPQSKLSTPVKTKTKPVEPVAMTGFRLIAEVVVSGEPEIFVREAGTKFDNRKQNSNHNSTPKKQQNTSSIPSILKETDQNLTQVTSSGKKQRRLIYNPVPHVSATKENMSPLEKIAYDIWKKNNVKDTDSTQQEKISPVKTAHNSPKKPPKPPKISPRELKIIIQNIHDKNTSSETSSTSTKQPNLPDEPAANVRFKLVAKSVVPGEPEIFLRDAELSPKVFRKFGLGNVRPLYKPNTRSRSIEPQTIKTKIKDKPSTVKRTSPRKPNPSTNTTTTKPKSPKKPKPTAKPKQASRKRRATSSPTRKLPKKIGKNAINEILLEETPTPEALAQTMFDLLSQLSNSRTNTEESDTNNAADAVVNDENKKADDFDIKQEVIAPNKMVSVKQEV